MVNKKGQGQGFTMVELLIALFILVLVVVGLVYVFSRSSQNVAAISPAILDQIAQGCNVAAASSSFSAFCDDYKEVNDVSSGKQFINCEYPGLKLQNNPLACSAISDYNQCQTLKTNGRNMDKTIVNKQFCNIIIANYLVKNPSTAQTCKGAIQCTSIPLANCDGFKDFGCNSTKEASGIITSCTGTFDCSKLAPTADACNTLKSTYSQCSWS